MKVKTSNDIVQYHLNVLLLFVLAHLMLIHNLHCSLLTIVLAYEQHSIELLESGEVHSKIESTVALSLNYLINLTASAVTAAARCKIKKRLITTSVA